MNKAQFFGIMTLGAVAIGSVTSIVKSIVKRKQTEADKVTIAKVRAVLKKTSADVLWKPDKKEV
jgi:hypothetical protein